MASRTKTSLYQTLYRLFTVDQLHEYQREILGLPWHRIYTTNYDDTVEFFRADRRSNKMSYSYDDERPKKLPIGAVIHLHGTIRNATEDNVLQQIVLNERSYVRQHFEKSSWYDEFNRDLNFCTACYFIGYSLSDYHISALLMENPDTCRKTYFVNEEEVDEIFCNRIKPYGAILPGGIDGFAELCRTLPSPESISSPHSIKSFQYLDPQEDRLARSSPTALEIQNLIMYGTFNHRRCIDTLPKDDYVVPRQDLAKEAADRLENARSLLVHARIGNGKSIFLYILGHMLSQRGYRCFFLRGNAPVIPRDVEILKEIGGKLVIVFDSYDSAIEITSILSDLTGDIKFVVAVRTSVQEVRLHEIYRRLPAPVDRVDLNGISREDISCFGNLLKNSGISVRNLKKTISRCVDFRDVVVTLYNNEYIRSRIEEEFAPLLKDREFRRVFVASQLLTWIGQHADAAFIRGVTDCDGYAAITKHRDIAGDIFALDDGRLQVRSPIFSEYLIQNHLTAEDIVGCVHAILVEAVKRRGIERRYQAILSSLMRYSTLNRALHADPDRMILIERLFERLRRDVDVQKMPLFWLQYSILMTDRGDLKVAETFIDTAYSYAEQSDGFHTFQIDTYALGLFLQIEQRSAGAGSVTRFDRIIEKVERVRYMIGEESRRFHAVDVLRNIEPFVSSRVAELSRGEKMSLVQHLHLLDQELGGLSREERSSMGADAIRASLSKARRLIVEVDSR